MDRDERNRVRAERYRDLSENQRKRQEMPMREVQNE